MSFLNFIARTFDIMKFSLFRFEYTEELSSEEFKKIEEKFERKAMEIFEKETAYINFRTLNDVDTIFEEIYGDVALTLDKIQSKHPIQTSLWIDEKLKTLEKYLSEEQAVKHTIAENLSNLTINYTKDEIWLINLYSNMFTELYQAMHFLEKTLFWERHLRKSHLVKILRVFNGILLVNLRIMEVERH